MTATHVETANNASTSTGELSVTDSSTFLSPTTSIQSEVDSGRKSIVLPTGELEVDNPITLSDDVTVEGAHGGTVLVPLNDAPMFNGQGLQWVTVKNLRVWDRDLVTTDGSAAIDVNSWRRPTLQNILVTQYATAYHLRTTLADQHTRYGTFVGLGTYYCREADMKIWDSVQDNYFGNLLFWSDPGIGSGGGLVMDRTQGDVTGQHGGNRFHGLSIIGAPEFGLKIVNYDQVWFQNVIVDGVDNGAGIELRAIGVSPKQITMNQMWSNVNGEQGMIITGDSTTPCEDLRIENFSFGSNSFEGLKLGNVVDSTFSNGIIHSNGGNGIRYQNTVENTQFSDMLFRGNIDYAINHNGHGMDNAYSDIRYDRDLSLGTRHTLEGIGVNGSFDPSIEGEWDAHGREGVIVKWDDGAGTDYLSLYRNETWWDWATSTAQ